MDKPNFAHPEATKRSFDRSNRSVNPRRPRRSKWRLILRIVGFLVLAAVAFAVYILIKLGVNPLDLGGLRADAAGRTNVLILGVGGAGHDGEKLSDTNLVVSLDRSSKSQALISVPRDLRVSIPGFYTAKVNAANVLGGPVLAEQTIGNTLDLPMHYYLQVDFGALKQAVDAVGGLKVTVKEELLDPGYPCDDNQYRSCGLDIKPGVYIMDGTMALAYSRCRKGTCGNDFGRAQRQQEILGLLKAKLLSAAVILNPGRINALAGVWREHVTTDMTLNNLIRLVWSMSHSQKTYNLVLDESPGGFLRGTGASDLVPVEGNFKRIQETANHVFTSGQ